MEDKSLFTNNQPHTISEGLQNFIDSMVEEIVLGGRAFDAQKKWLRKYVENEGINYEELEKNLNEFFETMEELKRIDSKSSKRLAGMLVKDCFLSEGAADKLITAVGDDRFKEVAAEPPINYETVTLGGQEWMVKNMAVTVDRDGNKLVLGRDYWYPNGDKSLVEQYGLLYTWMAAMRIAPKGWHVPSDAEWTQLEEYVGSQPRYRYKGNSSYIAKALAATKGWESGDDKYTAGKYQSKNNATGFSAMPAGDFYGSYGGFGYHADCWSATQVDSGCVFWYLVYDCASVYRSNCGKYAGLSVRCLRD